MRSFLGLSLLVVLIGCGTTPPQQPYVSPGVTAPANTAIDVTAYNLEIRRQGMSHYCSSGNCDELPVLLKAYAPIYPAAELEAGINGQATIVFDVLENGALANFKIESTSGESFSKAAIEALKLWIFIPPKLGGKPVKSASRQAFPFVAR